MIWPRSHQSRRNEPIPLNRRHLYVVCQPTILVFNNVANATGLWSNKALPQVIHTLGMALMVWNTRGFNAAKEKRKLIRIAKEKCVDIIRAFETKITKKRQSPVWEFFNGEWETLSNSTTSNDHCEDSIWIIWNPKILKGGLKLKKRQLINMNFLNSRGLEILISFVYASNEEVECRELWVDLVHTLTMVRRKNGS